MVVKIQFKDSSISLPVYKTAGAAGADICAGDDGFIEPGGRVSVPTGFFMEIPEGYEAQIRPRSGLARKYGIGMLNSPGTIDSDYRGEVHVLLYNSSNERFYYKKGDRIAQMIFVKVEKAEFVISAELADTERGSGGFGSTGI